MTALMPTNEQTVRRGSATAGPLADRPPRLNLGTVFITTMAELVLAAGFTSPWDLLARHVNGDWGEMPEEMILRNRRAVAEGGTVSSSYRLLSGELILVMTRGPRLYRFSVVMTPDDWMHRKESRPRRVLERPKGLRLGVRQGR